MAPEGEEEPPAEDEEPEEEEEDEEDAASSEDDKKKKVGRRAGAKDDKVSKSGAGRPKRAGTGRAQGIYASDNGIRLFLCREIKRIAGRLRVSDMVTAASAHFHSQTKIYKQ